MTQRLRFHEIQDETAVNQRANRKQKQTRQKRLCGLEGLPSILLPTALILLFPLRGLPLKVARNNLPQEEATIIIQLCLHHGYQDNR